MKNPFSIDKSFTIRHKILEVLYNDWEKNGREYNRRIGSIRVAKETNISIGEIERLQNLLVGSGEISASFNDDQAMMSIQPQGVNSCVDQKYIKDGRKNRWDRIFDYSRIIIPLLALVIAIVSFVYTLKLKERVSNLESKTQKK